MKAYFIQELMSVYTNKGHAERVAEARAINAFSKIDSLPGSYAVKEPETDKHIVYCGYNFMGQPTFEGCIITIVELHN